MAPIIYKLIDGEFFRELCRSYSKEIGVDIWAKIDWRNITGKDRTFIYDSLPAKKSNQSEAEFEAEFVERKADLDRLRKLPNIFVKDGFGKFRSREKRR
ncbi:MAG: hypothetical protein JWS10_3905, partial [Cypionkella sp.]|uniref:hypothetical protein n=1 Tax=Cypionkella sp. TaxID=2811411 RepID=UPI00262DBEDC